MKPRWLAVAGCVAALSAHAQDAAHGANMSSMRAGDPPADARSADYSDGYHYGSMRGMDMFDDSAQGMLLLDQFEYAQSNHGDGTAFVDGEAWYGADFNKFWLKFEGRSGDEFRAEALWDHAVAPFLDTQLGVRRDSGAEPGRTWAAFGVQGLAPYRIETEATLYFGQNGRTAARMQFEYEALLTQRLILQPKLEANFYGKDDRERGVGAGLSDAELGLRLRYDIKREFAPYIGIVWQQRCGRTADFARAGGEQAGALQFVAGLRVWF